MEKTIFDREPDVEVMFEFVGTRNQNYSYSPKSAFGK
jgi:hypothetical protein